MMMSVYGTVLVSVAKTVSSVGVLQKDHLPVSYPDY
jgi:hypothetical protein